ncbi:hypothetical protein L5515_019421 [Caenorhabditis briggsae]|uniref:Uncharacterized protein n=1 Tax=Caenorhabditis briggsae TaxID=6238 RepID=A0AAE9JTQ8_CAEBR|nr:hypothetical protein L5515_019421 [Caenorhabditis briggsae]
MTNPADAEPVSNFVYTVQPGMEENEDDQRPATKMRPVRQRTFCIPLLYLLACLAGCVESCHFACECEDDDDSDVCDDLIEY